jgi:hypothetical protein
MARDITFPLGQTGQSIYANIVKDDLSLLSILLVEAGTSGFYTGDIPNNNLPAGVYPVYFTSESANGNLVGVGATLLQWDGSKEITNLQPKIN